MAAEFDLSGKNAIVVMVAVFVVSALLALLVGELLKIRRRKRELRLRAVREGLNPIIQAPSSKRDVVFVTFEWWDAIGLGCLFGCGFWLFSIMLIVAGKILGFFPLLFIK